MELAEEGHCFLFFFLSLVRCYVHMGGVYRKKKDREEETEKEMQKRRIHFIEINEKVHNCEKLEDCVNLDAFQRAIHRLFMTNGAKNMFF